MRLIGAPNKDLGLKLTSMPVRCLSDPLGLTVTVVVTVSTGSTFTAVTNVTTVRAVLNCHRRHNWHACPNSVLLLYNAGLN